MDELELSGGYQPEVTTPPAPRRRGTAFIITVLQLFVFPLGIVIFCTCLFVTCSWMTYEKTQPNELLATIRGEGASPKWLPSYQARWQAAFELYNKLKSDEAARRDPALVRALIDTFEKTAEESSPKVRIYLASILGMCQAPGAVPPLIEALNDPHADVRIHSAITLGEIGDRRAVPALIALLDDDDAGVRKAAAFSLGKLGDSRATASLKARLTDAVEDVRWNSALALARMEDPAGVAVMEQMLDRSYLDGVVRQAVGSEKEGLIQAHVILAMVGAIQGVALLDETSLQPRLVALAEGDESIKVRRAALEALERMRN